VYWVESPLCDRRGALFLPNFLFYKIILLLFICGELVGRGSLMRFKIVVGVVLFSS
jgi:hypothetical protein